MSASRTAAPSTSGASAWRRTPATRSAQRFARRRRQQPGGRLCRHQVGRVAAQIRTSGRGGPRLLPVAAGARDRVTSPSRSSGTRRSPPTWWLRRAAGNNTVDDNGTPLWRMAPGRTVRTGRKARSAATRTSVRGRCSSPRRSIAARRPGSTPSSSSRRRSTSRRATSDSPSSATPRCATSHFTERAPKLGGMIEFYRSPDRVAWTPTGINVPDYPKLAQLFWENIGDVNSGAFTPQQAMDRLAEQMDDVMARMQAVDESNNVYHGCGPRLNERSDPREVAQRRACALGQARQREAAGRDDQLRRTREALDRAPVGTARIDKPSGAQCAPRKDI